ncbi:MAG: Eco57I restriction-modification methylase domain-containing protein [Fimbriimonadaceae bacterium]|nr:Eco57I restriction-modification methylase domain-containing protein [Fimbriimonadaceae bacterium]
MSVPLTLGLRGHNPDILTCIANLSNDEVFTPPELANRMLDTLAEAWAKDHDGANLWADPNVRFLDPCAKSGVFLREITRRLSVGLAAQMPDVQARVDHILTQQVFGIAVTRLTALLTRRSLYCSKNARGKHSIGTQFTTNDGNVWWQRLEHTWHNDRCVYCGAPRSVFDRDESRETHAYAFIHTRDIQARITELFGKPMQFDVIIGNPPYQLECDGGTRDIPIYQHFVEQAKQLEPQYLVMVIPSRWMASGLGLASFRQAMLSDRCIRELVDYPVAKEVFPGVEIKAGVCYFLRDRYHDGDCRITTIRGNASAEPQIRSLGEFDVLVRDSNALSILRKVLAHKEPSINTILARDKEFGWTSNFTGIRTKQLADDIPVYYIRKNKRAVGFVARSEVKKSEHLVDVWKLLVPEAYGAGETEQHQILGKPIVAPSPSACTQSYLFFSIHSRSEAESLRSYYQTRLFRFLVSLRKITQHATHSTYVWVPMQTWDRTWTESELYGKYGLTEEEQKYIASRIKVMDAESSDDE